MNMTFNRRFARPPSSAVDLCRQGQEGNEIDSKPSSSLCCVRFGRAGAESLFWYSDSAEVREEGMYQLAFELDVEDSESFLRSLPKGYAAVHWIFTWEQSRAGEGFCTGIENSGVSAVENAADCYSHLGMAEEAAALRAMLSQYAITPENYAEVEAAYESLENPYLADWDRIPRVVNVLCNRAEKLFYERD